MPLYKFDISLKSGKTITGMRFYESKDLDQVFRSARVLVREKYGRELDKFDCMMVSTYSETYFNWWKAYRKKHPWVSDQPEWSVDMDPLEPCDPGDPPVSKKEQHSKTTREAPGWGELKKQEREKKL